MNIKKSYGISQTPHIYDIAPTIAAIFKLDAPRVWKGKSIKELFEDENI
jgi:arylsulfatase A-like enzyme